MNTRHKYIFTAAIAVLSLASCTKFLTRDAENQTTDEKWWMTKGQLNTVVNECYMAMNRGTIMSNASIPWDGGTTNYAQAHLLNKVENEGLSDNGVTCANYIDNSAFTSGTLSSKHGNVTNFWKGRYISIRLCCRFLENYHRAVFDPDKQPYEGVQTVDRWAAEVRALRAYYHMDLYMNFGPVPIVDKVVSPQEQNLARATREQCVNWIVSEFKLASENLPVKPQVSQEKWRWTKGAVYSYISYLYMFEGDYANAKIWAKKVIDLGVYELYKSPTDPASSYSEMFLHEAFEKNDTKECILSKENGCTEATVRLNCPGFKNGGTGVCPTASLVDSYELADGRTIDELSADDAEKLRLDPKAFERDPRLYQTVLFPNETFLGYTNKVWDYDSANLDYIGKRNSTKTGYWVKKWVNETDVNSSNMYNTKLPFMLMRYSVVLLNYAECVIELGESSEYATALKYINDIRKRAGQCDASAQKYSTQEKLRELVRRERRVELAFEGHRIFDIRRWKIGVETMNGPVYGAPYADAEGNTQLYQAETRYFNPDRDYVWPIPSTEMSYNTNMVQNQGY